jgi:hypothetical protein
MSMHEPPTQVESVTGELKSCLTGRRRSGMTDETKIWEGVGKVVEGWPCVPHGSRRRGATRSYPLLSPNSMRATRSCDEIRRSALSATYHSASGNASMMRL